MRCLITTKSRSLYVIPLLIDFPTSCNAFFTTSCNTRCFSPQQIDRHSSSNAIKLLAGRERRTSSSSSSTPSSSSSPSSFSDAHSVEQKLLQKEEEARQKRNGQAKRRLEKSVRREERISVLESKANSDDGTGNGTGIGNMITEAEMAELKGLLKVRSTFEEQYDPLTFTKEHLDFKSMHNDALIALSRYCERERKSCISSSSGGSGGSDGSGEETQSINVFFLDGPDGGTANAMLDQGNFDAKQLFVANRHESSCNLLKISGGGRLPDENVVHATATEALTIGATPLSTPLDTSSNDNNDDNDDDKSIIREEGGAFSNIDFSAYYFDGCGGFVPHITSMMSAALLREGCDPQKPIAVGYSLLGGNKDVVEKELAVSQALTIIARKRGMRMVHVMDDPSRYGLPLDIKKIGGSGGGGTFTTWLLLESEK